MGLSALQAALFAALVILVSGASLAPRSASKTQQMRSGGGGGGGGYGGGIGFGSGFGGGFGGGSSGQDENPGGNDDGDDGGEYGGDDDEDDSEIGGDGGEDGDEYGGDSGEDDNGGEDGGGSGVDGEDDGDGDSTDGGQDGSDCGPETAVEDDSTEGDAVTDTDDEKSDDGNTGDSESSGCGCNSKSTKSSDTKWKRNTRLIKSTNMGESSIPSSLWQSSGKKAPRSYYYGYYNDGNLVYGGSEDVASHIQPHDISNIITVIPWLFNPFMRGLALKITPLGPEPRAFIPQNRIAGVNSQLRFKREVDMKDEEEDAEESGVTAEDSGNEDEDDSSDMGESEDQGLEEAAEEDGLDSEYQPEDTDASEDAGEEVEEMQEDLEGSGDDGVMEEAMEEQLNIAQQVMDPSLLEPLILGPETTSSDAFRKQARAVRSMEQDNVVEDVNVALKTNVKTVGSPKSAGGAINKQSTRLLGLDLGQALDLLDLQLNVGR